MKTRRSQTGQAIVEMTVSLIGMAAIFCGFILIVRLATGSIESVLSARENADKIANNPAGVIIGGGDTGEPILYWKGKTIVDNARNITTYPYRYRRDDESEKGTLGDSNIFTGQLIDETSTFDIDSSLYVDRANNFKSLRNDCYMFLNAADLKSGIGSNSITFDSDLPTSMTSVLLLDDPTIRSINVEDTLYMPFTH
jgi:hypothetical protein